MSLSTFNTSVQSYPFPLYQSAYRHKDAYPSHPLMPNPLAGPRGRPAPLWSGALPAASVLNDQPPRVVGPMTGSEMVLFMESDCTPGTAVGGDCSPDTAIRFDVCLLNDHTSGTSIGIRKCL